MPWVKIDDHFTQHPKIAAAGPLAIAMQVAGLCYCNRELTDGFIPRAIARTLLDWQVAREDGRVYTVGLTCGMTGDDVDCGWVIGLLLEAGMWEEVPGGFRIHDYLDYQPSRDEVIHEREAARGRMQKVRAARRAQEYVQGSPEVRANIERSSTTPVPVPVPDPEPNVGDTPTPPTRARKAPAYSDEFERFWTAYPKGHGNKKQAFEQWRRLAPDADTQADMLDGITRWQQSDRWQRGFIRDAERWIRDRSWEDAPPPSVAPVPSPPSANGRASPFEKTRAAFAEVDAALDDWIAQQSRPDAIETTGRRHA